MSLAGGELRLSVRAGQPGWPARADAVIAAASTEAIPPQFSWFDDGIRVPLPSGKAARPCPHKIGAAQGPLFVEGFGFQRTAVSTAAAMLQFGHRHVFCTHDHHDAASECICRERVDRMRFGVPAPWADDIVLEGRAIRREIRRSAFRKRVVRTQHGNGYSAAFSGQANCRRLINGPALDMWELKPDRHLIHAAARRQLVRAY
jgi:hypothetical protein